MEWSALIWAGWFGMMLGFLLGSFLIGLLTSRKQSDLEIELYEGRAVREALKEEIFRLENQAKPKPRSKRRRI